MFSALGGIDVVIDERMGWCYRQVRFPRSMRLRMRKKWRKDRRNWAWTYSGPEVLLLKRRPLVEQEAKRLASRVRAQIECKTVDLVLGGKHDVPMPDKADAWSPVYTISVEPLFEMPERGDIGKWLARSMDCFLPSNLGVRAQDAN